MPKDFIPSNDAALLAWCKVNLVFLEATPTAFGLTAAIVTAYDAKVTAFETALTAATGDSRSRVDVANKDDAKRALIANIRAWARTVQAHPGITTGQRLQLGLNPRDALPTPIHPPENPPVLKVVSAIGRRFKLEVRGIDTEGRGKPDKAAGVVVLSYVGPVAPANPSEYSLEGPVTRTNFELEMPYTVAPGSRVWLCAAWYSPRGQLSPLCDPVSAYIAGGISTAAQTTGTTEAPLREAA